MPTSDEFLDFGLISRTPHLARRGDIKRLSFFEPLREGDEGSVQITHEDGTVTELKPLSGDLKALWDDCHALVTGSRGWVDDARQVQRARRVLARVIKSTTCASLDELLERIETHVQVLEKKLDANDSKIIYSDELRVLCKEVHHRDVETRDATREGLRSLLSAARDRLREYQEWVKARESKVETPDPQSRGPVDALQQSGVARSSDDETILAVTHFLQHRGLLHLSIDEYQSVVGRIATIISDAKGGGSRTR